MSLVQSARLDRRVTILRPTYTTDEHNEQVAGEPVRTERWAAVLSSPGTERFQSAETAAAAPMHFIFHWEDGLVRVTDSIEHDGRTYGVTSIEEIGRRRRLRVLATARGE